MKTWVDIELRCRQLGLTPAEFCRLCGLSPASYYAGLRRKSRLSSAVKHVAEQVFERVAGEKVA